MFANFFLPRPRFGLFQIFHDAITMVKKYALHPSSPYQTPLREAKIFTEDLLSILLRMGKSLPNQVKNFKEAGGICQGLYEGEGISEGKYMYNWYP